MKVTCSFATQTPSNGISQEYATIYQNKTYLTLRNATDKNNNQGANSKVSRQLNNLLS